MTLLAVPAHGLLKAPHHTYAKAPHSPSAGVGRAPRATPERRHPRADIRTDTGAASAPGRVGPRQARARAAPCWSCRRTARPSLQRTARALSHRRASCCRPTHSLASRQPNRATPLSCRASSPLSTRHPAWRVAAAVLAPVSRARRRQLCSCRHVVALARAAGGGDAAAQ